jgi:hypothetical protein
VGLVVGEVSARAAAEHVVPDLAVALDLELADRMSAVAADGHLPDTVGRSRDPCRPVRRAREQMAASVGRLNLTRLRAYAIDDPEAAS